MRRRGPLPWGTGIWLGGEPKTALVTGSAGFVGRHMVRRLEAEGYHVTGLDLKNGTNCLHHFRLSEKRYDVIVHAAYNIGGRESIDGVNMNLAKNLILDSEMFQYALRTNAGHVLYFSSSAAYPIYLQSYGHSIPLREEDMNYDQPDAGYGWAKVTGEKLAEQAKSMGLSVSVVRPFSGYGSDQDNCYPFPSIVKRAMSGEFTVWGPTQQTRDWIHIDDIIEACLEMIYHRIPGPVNLCTGVGTTMGELLKLARFIYNQGVLGDDDIFFDVEKPTGVLNRVGDPTLLKTFYSPQISLVAGILEAILKYEEMEK